MVEEVSHNKEQSGEISIRNVILKIHEYYRYLLSKWVTILIFGMIGGILGIAASILKKTSYIATTTFVLGESEGGGGLGQYSGLASMVGLDVGGGGGGIFQGDNILELYKSRTMIEKTLLTEVDNEGKKELLIEDYITFNKLREQWNKIPELKGIRFTVRDEKSLHLKSSRLQDSILGSIVKDINKSYLNVSKPDKKLSVILAEVKSPDEFFAKTFNDQIVKNVNDFYVQTKTEKSVKNIAILQQKTDSVRAVMNGSLSTVAAINDATPNLNITRQAQRTAPVQRSQFNAETNKAVLGQLLQNLEISKMSLLKETPLIQVIDQPVYPLEKKRLSKSVGMVVGGLVCGFLVVIFLIFKKIIKNLIVQ